MSKRKPVRQIDLTELGRVLQMLGQAEVIKHPSDSLCDLLVDLNLVERATDQNFIATNQLFSLGPTRSTNSAVRRVLSLQSTYRSHLLTLLLEAVKTLADDQSLAETVEQLDHLAPELLRLTRTPLPQGETTEQFDEWDASVWQAPDAVTLLSKVVETPADFATLPHRPIIAVGFDWLAWVTPPSIPAPAPWADAEPLNSPLGAARHPFWGAMVATLDACTGDYEWQSLILSGDLLRSQHRTLGTAAVVMESLWRREFGLYPAPPLIVPDTLTPALSLKGEGVGWWPGKPLPWLQLALDQLAEKGIAVESEGSWRLTDDFRTQLMSDDEHMIAFEALRQRSYRLARAAQKITETANEMVAS